MSYLFHTVTALCLGVSPVHQEPQQPTGALPTYYGPNKPTGLEALLTYRGPHRPTGGLTDLLGALLIN